MVKEWKDRKESHFGHLSDTFSGGNRTQLTDKDGRHVDAWGRNKEESRKNAYKQWDEKYR